MKTNLISLVSACALVLSVAGCAQNGEDNPWGMGNKQTIGTVGGAIAGGELGSLAGHGSGKGWMTGIGAVVGALAGGSIGKSLDNQDKAMAQKAAEQAETGPIGQPISWNNPDNGHSGTITPTRQGHTSDNRTCREYTQTINVGGQPQTGVGTACQNADGSWAMVSGAQ